MDTRLPLLQGVSVAVPEDSINMKAGCPWC
jgi:hypothetical protein